MNLPARLYSHFLPSLLACSSVDSVNDNDNDVTLIYIPHFHTLQCALQHFVGDCEQTALSSLQFERKFLQMPPISETRPDHKTFVP